MVQFYIISKNKNVINVQRGLRKLLHINKKISYDIIINCLNEYGTKYFNINKFDNIDKEVIIQSLNDNKSFNTFLQIVTEKTNIKFSKRFKPQKSKKNDDSYSNYWINKQLDGDFAYNNSSNDF